MCFSIIKTDSSKPKELPISKIHVYNSVKNSFSNQNLKCKVLCLFKAFSKNFITGFITHPRASSYFDTKYGSYLRHERKMSTCRTLVRRFPGQAVSNSRYTL